MKKIISVAFIFFACTAMLLAGCSKKVDEVDTKPTPSSMLEGKKEGSIYDNNDRIEPDYSLKSNLKEYTIKEAWGDVPIIQKTFTSAENKTTMALSISDEGDLLLDESITKTVNFVDSWNQTLKISNINNGKTETIKSISSPTRIPMGSINSDWVVWSEEKWQGISAYKSSIYGYNRKTKKTKLYYETLDYNEDETAIVHVPEPRLKGNEFLIDIVTGKRDDPAPKITSHKYNLITGKSEVIAEQFARPQWGDTGYIGLGQVKDKESYSQFLKVENGKKKPLMENGVYAYDYDSDGVSVIYNEPTFKTVSGSVTMQLSLWLCENGEELLLQAATEQSGCGWPTLSKRIAMWNFDSKPYAYDRVLKKSVVLCEEPQGSTYFTSDKYFMWKSQAENDADGVFSILNIIEIDKLPKK